MKKYLFAILALLLVSIFAFAACGGNGDDPADQETDTGVETPVEPDPVDPDPVDVERLERHLRLAFPLQHTIIFNPMVIGNEHETVRLLLSNLFYRVVCPDLEWPIFIKEMAADYPQQMDDEGLVWRLFVEPGWTFDDGTPINAHSFEFAIMWQNDPLLQNRNSGQNSIHGLPGWYMGQHGWDAVINGYYREFFDEEADEYVTEFMEPGFRIIDDYTFELRYYPQFRPQFGAVSVAEGFAGGGNAPIHPELWMRNLEEDGLSTSWGREPWYPYISPTGTHQAVQYITDQTFTFERRPGYIGPMNEWITADRITWTIAPDEATQTMLFETGEMDQAIANASRFDEYPGLYFVANGFVYGIFLNSLSEVHPILQDLDFRAAMYWSLDRERIVGMAFPTALPQSFLAPASARYRQADFLESGVWLNWRDSEYGRAVTVNGHPLTQNGFEPERALEYFNRAWEANGSVPIVMELIYSDAGEAQQMWAEAIQEAWQSLFGADRFSVTLRAVPTLVALEQHLQRHALDYDIVADRRVWMGIADEPARNTNWVATGHRHSWDTQYMILTEEAQIEHDRLIDIFDDANRHTVAHRNLRNSLGVELETVILNDHSFIPMYNHADRMRVQPWLQSIIPNGHYGLRLAPFQFVWDDALYAEMMGQ